MQHCVSDKVPGCGLARLSVAEMLLKPVAPRLLNFISLKNKTKHKQKKHGSGCKVATFFILSSLYIKDEQRKNK